MLLKKRVEYEPFEYPQAYQYWLDHQYSYWNHTKISFEQDVYDFRLKLSDAQRNVIGNTLKSFTQTELVVGQEYWSDKVAKWFPKPEISLMALEFAAREMIHAVSYSQVDINLGIRDYSGFLQETTVKKKIDTLVGLPGKTKEEKALSLAVFSAFTEGVNLFSSFAILLNFSRFDLMPGIGALINYSVKDENEHSEAGCWLFKTFAEEYNLYTLDVKKNIYEAARAAVQLEDDFLDKVFELGDIPGLEKNQLRQFIRQRANQKLNDLGLKTNWKNIDQGALVEIDDWFSAKTSGERDGDFFKKRLTGAYSKGNIDWSKMWENLDV